ncbi:MAG: hypothetical protein ACTSUE_10285 [Promethearchaeota archaeon]
MEPYTDKPSFQRVYGIRADPSLKGAGSKARVVTYLNLHLQAGVGLTSKDSWLINMNSWLKPREMKAAHSLDMQGSGIEVTREKVIKSPSNSFRGGSRINPSPDSMARPFTCTL